MPNMGAKVAAAYRKEQERPIIPVEASDIPSSYEAITPGWLTEVLCHDAPGAKVVSLTLGDVDNGTSNRRKIGVEYNRAGNSAGLPNRLFCKASHDLAIRLGFGHTGSGSSEIYFYDRLRRRLDIEAPNCYYGNLDTETFNSILILGDISDEVESFCTHETHISRPRAESQILLLAKMHARFHEGNEAHKELSALPTWFDFFQTTLDFGLREGSNQGFLDAQEVIPPSLYGRFEEIWPATLESIAENKSLPKTFTHNDVHLKNWYVMPGDRMGLADWQCCGVGHWGRDLAYTLSTALTVANRRTWEEDLVRYYVEELSAAGVAGVTFDDAWKHYRKQLLSSLTWWTITYRPTAGMPDMQPADVTLEFIRRISTAMDDLGTLDLF
jgi:hypothetical protein